MTVRDPAAPLVRALLADAVAAGCRVRPLATDTRDWSSATFTGARHRILLSGRGGSALDGWLAALPAAALSLSRGLLGDLTVDAAERHGDIRRIALSALTLDMT